MKKVLFILPLILFAGCGIASEGYITFENSSFFELKNEDLDESLYIRYPQGGVIEDDGSVHHMNYQGCDILFYKDGGGEDDSFEFVATKTNEKDGIDYQAWYQDDVLIKYMAYNKENRLWFVASAGTGVSKCVNILEKMAESVTDKPLYVNDKFGFKVDILSTFKLEYLPSGEGVLLKRWVEDKCTDDFGDEYVCGYKVEIYVFAENNVMEFKNLAELLSDKYTGYSVEFMGNGVFVNEGAGEDAVRHYIMMSEGSDIIYEAYLKVPSDKYSYHKDGFDEFVNSFEIL